MARWTLAEFEQFSRDKGKTKEPLVYVSNSHKLKKSASLPAEKKESPKKESKVVIPDFALLWKWNPFNERIGAEDWVQIETTEYVRNTYIGSVCYHAPNEGKRGAFARYLIKLLGVKSGFPDLLIFYNGKVIAIELKATDRRRKGALTDAQLEWIDILNSVGIPAFSAFGFQEAKEIIDREFNS